MAMVHLSDSEKTTLQMWSDLSQGLEIAASAFQGGRSGVPTNASLDAAAIGLSKAAVAARVLREQCLCEMRAGAGVK